MSEAASSSFASICIDSQSPQVWAVTALVQTIIVYSKYSRSKGFAHLMMIDTDT